MHCWTATDAQPGLPRVACAAINVVNSFKIFTCSWLLWGPRSRAWLSLITHLFNTPSIVSVSVDLLGNWAHDCVEFWLNARYLLGIIFFAWSLLFGLLGLAPKCHNSSTVAHRLCMISAHGRSHTLLPNALYSSAPTFRPYHHWKSSMWWCGQVLHFWYHQVMHHPSDLCVCVPQIESVILLFFE